MILAGVRRCVAVALAAAGAAGGALGQSLSLQPAAGGPGCAAVVDAINRGLAARDPAAMSRAATEHETGLCLERDPVKAVLYLGAAARAGDAVAARRLSRKFARGQGVAQSYANAGAWLAGKGASDEPLEPWDYAVGYAHAVLGEALDRVELPLEALRGVEQLSIVVESSTPRAAALTVRMVEVTPAGAAPALAPITAALQAAAQAADAQLAPPDPSLLVPARVAVPVSLRWRGERAIDLLQDQPILR